MGDPGSKLCRAINFYDFTDICQKFQLSTMAQWVGKQGSEALGTGSNPSLYLHFQNLLIRRKIVTSLSLSLSYAWNFSIPEISWNTKLLLRIFSVLWDKKIDKIVICITFFDTRNFLKHRKVPLRSFSVLWEKIFRQNRDTHSFA